MNLHNVKMIATLSCEKASHLASDALDRDLSMSERLALRLHCLICRSCRRVVKQLATMRALLSQSQNSSQQILRDRLPQLSSDRKQQIKRLLNEATQSETG
jgi:predicted anti-sigma-YlaC factor YlaD